MKIAICTGGGDCPGLNSVIRAIVKHARRNHHCDVYGVYESFQGLLQNPPKIKPLLLEDVSEILARGGTILGTHNEGNPFAGSGGQKDLIAAKKVLLAQRFDCLFVIGGEGSQGIASLLVAEGVPIIGIPKTIDNDLPLTDQTVGFSTCIDLVAESVMRLSSTAESHHRIMILEVMGRDSGYIALHGGIAGGAHAVLIPEIPYSYEAIAGKISERKKMGCKYSVVVVSEGATEYGGSPTFYTTSSGNKNLGGVGQRVAQELFKHCSMETRFTVLGHLQRGGSPNASDRILGSRFGIYAVDLAMKKAFGSIVSLQGGKITHFPYTKLNRGERRQIKLEDEIIKVAEGLGICLGR